MKFHIQRSTALFHEFSIIYNIFIPDSYSFQTFSVREYKNPISNFNLFLTFKGQPAVDYPPTLSSDHLIILLFHPSMQSDKVKTPG